MRRHGPLMILATLILTLSVATAAFAAEFTRTFDFDSKELEVANLIGSVSVVPASGSDFKVTVAIMGDDASEELMDFVMENGSKGRLAVKFPIEDHDDYIYPELGRNSKTTMTIDGNDAGNSWIKKIFSGVYGEKITVKGKGNGLELWADVTIEVPRGRELEVYHGVGTISAGDLEADLVLDTRSGPITAENIEGDVLCDTGSGSVKVTDIQGDVNVDTGSGSVKVRGCRGDEVLVDTGSGSVEVMDVECSYLLVDTGSGSVEARNIGTDKAKIDTGSGSAELQLDRMGKGDYVIDTGSGSIALMLPAGASAHITADTGSGRVFNEVSGADIRHKERDEIDMTVGDGESKVTLDAGSGSITISGG